MCLELAEAGDFERLVGAEQGENGEAEASKEPEKYEFLRLTFSKILNEQWFLKNSTIILMLQ